MTTQLDVAADILFPSQGNQAANIKFYGGWARAVSAEQMAAEFVRIEKLIIDEQIQPSHGIGD